MVVQQLFHVVSEGLVLHRGNVHVDLHNHQATLLKWLWFCTHETQRDEEYN